MKAELAGEPPLPGEIFKASDMWGPEDIKRLIIREDAFPEGQQIFIGATNHCIIKGFHIYIDCDNQELRDILAYCESVKGLGLWYILQTSPWNWSIVNFSRVSWKSYMWYLNNCSVIHDAYIYCTGLKGYGVIRQGAKSGLVPRLRYIVGFDNGKECKTCRDDFISSLDLFEGGTS